MTPRVTPMMQRLYDAVLTLLARCGVALESDVWRLFGEEDGCLAYHCLQDLLKLGFIAAERRIIKLPNGKEKEITVYFLTKAGVTKINHEFEDLIHDTRPGANRLDVWQIRTLVHDLYVTRAYVWFSTLYQICGFESEFRLRQEILDDRSAFGYARFSEAMGDFKICVRKKTGADDEIWYECEVVHSLKAYQIRAKPNNLVWFTGSETVADLIHDVKGDNYQKIIHLGELGEHDFYREVTGKTRKQVLANTSNYRQNLTGDNPPSSYEKVYVALENLGGVASIDALSASLRKDRKKCIGWLRELKRDDRLLHQTVGPAWREGNTGGAKTILYQTGEFYPLNTDRKRHFLMCSNWHVKMRSKGFRLYGYDRRYGCVVFATGSDPDLKLLIIVVDDMSLSAETVRDRFNGVRDEYENAEVRLHAYSAARSEQFGRLIDQRFISRWTGEKASAPS